MIRLLLHSYGQFDRRHPLQPVTWPHFDLFFVHAGQLRLRWGDGHENRLKQNEGLLIFPHTPFQGEALTPTVRASVQHFAFENEDREIKDPVFSRLSGRTHGAWPFATRGHTCLLQDIERALQLATKPPSAMMHELRLSQLRLIVHEIGTGRGLSRQSTPALPEPLEQALAWAQSNPGELSIETLAQKAGYSPSHFRALFQKHVGSSPGQYFRHLKINEARRLLRETRLPLKQIAADLGFADAVSFHRSFHSMMKSTPAYYRKRYAPRG